MATYFGTSINESPTIIMEAGAKLEDVQGIALAITAGKLAKPSAGANVIGLSLFTNDENVEAGGSLTVQVKDIGKWVAGEAIAVGDELATDAAGKAVKATDGAWSRTFSARPPRSACRYARSWTCTAEMPRTDRRL